MAAYTFRCPTCGTWDEQMRMGTAPQTVNCPACGAHARRVWLAPQVIATSAAGRVRAAEERCNDRPRVVTAEPSRAPGPRLTDPRQRRLPRP